MLAKQALRVKKRTTRNTVKDRLADLRNIAKRIRFLAQEVMAKIYPHVITNRIAVESRITCAVTVAPEHFTRRVSVDDERRQASGLCQDPSALHSLLTSGGRKGERLR